MKKHTGIICALLAAAVILSGCGSTGENTVSVESVASVIGMGSVGLNNRCAAVVTARDSVNIDCDSAKRVEELKVRVGDEVRTGDVLFTYDTDQMDLEIQKRELELEKLADSITTMHSELEELEKLKSWASQSQQLNYTVQIQETEANLREAEYNQKVQEAELDSMRESITVTEVKSPVDGVVQSINEQASADGSGSAFIVVREGGSFRVKGYIGEMNVGSIWEGMEVLVRSRVNETITWKGTISVIDWENPLGSQNGDYYGISASDDTASASRYPFYVELDDAEGLLLGQHVTVEQYTGETEEGLWLPIWYVVYEEDGTAFVWAENASGKLEKRVLSLGETNEEQATVCVLEGITEDDYLAFPDESYAAGMKVSHYDPNAAAEYEDPAMYDGGYEGEWSDDWTDDWTEDSGAYEIPAEEYGLEEAGIFEEAAEEFPEEEG